MYNHNSLFEQLRISCIEEWDAFCNHEFVDAIKTGTLPPEQFRFYLEQDYLYLIHLSRAFALGVYKSNSIEVMRLYAGALHATLNTEIQMHLDYCSKWGIVEDDLQDVDEARANMAYSRFVLDCGSAGDLLDLQVALAPCVVGYAEIGKALKHASNGLEPSNPYQTWIDTYASEEYQKLAMEHIELMEKLCSLYQGSQRFPGLVATFRKATGLEIAFWDMSRQMRY
ncbi:MAG: thiaminase II [Chitinivibrionales bacterium]|nr:thiaminase II [Chitinivibrionales bacterium]